MVGKKTRIAGWVLSGLISAFLILASASGKFTEWEGKEEMFARFGYTSELMFKIGVVEVACALLFVLPRTGFLGAVLLTAYLGGATEIHVSVGDPFYFPILFGVATWAALGMRCPQIFSLALGRPVAQTVAPQ